MHTEVAKSKSVDYSRDFTYLYLHHDMLLVKMEYLVHLGLNVGDRATLFNRLRQ